MSTGIHNLPYVPFAVTQSDSTVFNPPLKGLMVLSAPATATSTVAIKRPDGTTVSIKLPSGLPSDNEGGSYPTILPFAIRQILDTGTTLPDASMLALK